MSRVIVAGSIITDMSVKVKTHPKVGETVIASEVKYSPGGKGSNQAVAAARLGADTAIIGSIGEDEFGKMSYEFLESENINIQGLMTTDSSTGIAMIQVSEGTGDNSIAVVLGANEELKESNVENYTYRKNDVLVSQFEIPLTTVKRFFHKGRHSNCMNILNPAPAQIIPDEIMNLTDVVIFNETELSVCSGVDVITVDTAIIALDSLEKKYVEKFYIVTLGDKGSLGLYKGAFHRLSTSKVDVVDTTGAGDCFVGAFAAYIAELNKKLDTKEFIKAMEFANKAASLSVQKKGSGISMPYKKEL